MNVPSFSIVVIARNEAHKLPALFASLREFRDAGGEIVVVDTGSEDETVRVAREAGARVEVAGPRFHSTLNDEQAAAINRAFSRGGEGPFVEGGQLLFDFGSARQFAGQLASNEFVWQIDASDVVVSADYDFLDETVRGGNAAVFYYPLKLGPGSFRVTRFFDRRVYAWKGRVHEAPFGTGTTTGGRVVCAEEQLCLRHFSGEKSRNYLAGLALDAIELPTMPRWKHYLGRELYSKQHFRSAIPLLREHARSKESPVVERSLSLCLLGDCQDRLGRLDAAAESYFRAAIIDPSRREPLLRLADLCQKRGNFQGSVSFAAAALQVPRTGAVWIEDEEAYTWHAHSLLYWGLFWLGQREAARAHWLACRQMAPDNEKFVEDSRLFPD